MKPNLNYYAILGVTSTASPDEIVRAYRKTILEVHLDKLLPGQDPNLCYNTIEAYRVLSNRKLRAKYDIERDPSYKASEKFIPAGYICYDVGQSQMSKRVLKSISDWKQEFETLNVSGDGISDNYFECFSSIMGQVLEVEDQDNMKALMNKEESFTCAVCDKEFPSETLHWEEVLNPYIAMFSTDSTTTTDDEDPLTMKPFLTYFEKLLGKTHFTWEPRSLPSSPLGIWASHQWSHLENCDIVISRILEVLPTEDEFSDTESYIDFIEDTFFKRERDEILYPALACQILIFILDNQHDQKVVVDRVQECLFRDELTEILYLACVMKNYLGCDQDAWMVLADDAVSNEEPEMAMLWTKILYEFNEIDGVQDDSSNGLWYNLGVGLIKIDLILAHFSFLFQGYGDEEETAEEDWNDLGDDLCDRGLHLPAIQYFTHAEICKKRYYSKHEEEQDEDEEYGIEKLLLKSKSRLRNSDRAGASLYRNTYYSLKIKCLLAKLQGRPRNEAESEFDSELEQLISMIDDLDTTNPIEGFRIVSKMWPNAFESPVCQEIHKGTIAFLRRGRLSTTSFGLILGALHFLPENEDDEEEFSELQKELSSECNEMVLRQIQQSMKTSDFNLLLDVLLFICQAASPRCIPAVEQILNEMELGTQSQVIENSPHLKAMKLLIEGTDAKTKRDWLTAMNHYQNALFCSPELVYRVLPCISRLTQDIEFHEAILTQVHEEVKELKEFFDCEEYPEVDTLSAKKKANRNSLVISDISPQMDFGYKNSISKIQSDADAMNNPPPPPEEGAEPPPVETNTPLVTLDKTEEAIGSGKNQGQLNAALSYIDLLKALPTPFQPGPIVMAASHFLRAMDETADPGSLFALRNAIMQMAENLLKIDKKTQASIQHGLSHKHMLTLLLSAHEKLSKAISSQSAAVGSEDSGSEADSEDSGELADQKTDSEKSDNIEFSRKTAGHCEIRSSDDDDGSDSTESGSSKRPKMKRLKKTQKQSKLRRSSSSSSVKGPGVDLIKTSDAHLISKFMSNVVNFPKIQPLANIPTLNCSDLMYVENLGNSFLSQFCNEKVSQKHQSLKIPKHLHAYTHFVEVWKGRSQLTNFSAARLKAMEELLALRGWTLENVEQLLTYRLFNLTDDGWISEYRTELTFPNPLKSFKSIYGFKIDYRMAKVYLLMTRDKQNAYTCGNLFDTRDIREIFSSGIEPQDCILSLDSPNLNLKSHPFKEAKFSTSNPDCHSCHVPNLFLTLARAANFLCYMCSGLEICGKAPFHMKKTDEGLLNRLEEHLQHLLRPAKGREQEDDNLPAFKPDVDIPNRFWLNFTEVFEDEVEDELSSTLTYKVGDVKSQIKMNTLILTLNGTKASITPEAEFARDFTKHYDEIGQFYPELLRLKELVKISAICKKLKAILRSKTAILKQNGRGKVDQMRIACLVKSIRDLGIWLDEDDEKTRNVPGNFTDCNWFPATFCNNLDAEIYEVSAGVRINAQPTYFPVSLPPDCSSHNAKELLTVKKPSVSLPATSRPTKFLLRK